MVKCRCSSDTPQVASGSTDGKNGPNTRTATDSLPSESTMIIRRGAVRRLRPPSRATSILLGLCLWIVLLLLSRGNDITKNVHSPQVLKAQELPFDTSETIDIDAAVVPNDDNDAPSSWNNKAVQIQTPPRLGQHRPDVDAVLTLSVGYSLEQIIYFVTSLVDTGYDGDIVMGVRHPIENDSELKEFLLWYSEKHHLVVHELKFDCCCPRKGGFCKILGKSNNKTTTDPRPYRHPAVIRFEYYYDWASRYRKGSRILVTDSRDVFFQRSPFETLPTDMDSSLIMFDNGASNKDPNSTNSMKIIESLPDLNWIKNAYNISTFKEIKYKPSSCSGTTIGGKSGMMTYVRAMVDQFDYTFQTNHANGNYDQAFHNVLLHKDLLPRYYDGSGTLHVKLHMTGEPRGVVRTVAQEFRYRYTNKPLGEIPFFKNSSGEELVLNYDGSVPSVVHQADRNEEFRKILEGRAWNAMRMFKERTIVEPKTS